MLDDIPILLAVLDLKLKERNVPNMMDPGYEKPKKIKNAKIENDEDLLYEIEECNNSHPLDQNQFKVFRNELKLFTIKYICKIVKISDDYKEEIYPKLCDLCIYRKKCQCIPLTKNSPGYVRLITMDDLHYMATKGNCYFPDINTQKVIELKIKQLEITKFPFLYHLVTHNCFPIYKNYIVLTDENNLVDDSMDIPDIPLNYEYIFDYNDLEPEKEIKENKRRKFMISDFINKPSIFNALLILTALTAYLFSLFSIFLSDVDIVIKIFGGILITLLILIGILGIDRF